MNELLELTKLLATNDKVIIVWLAHTLWQLWRERKRNDQNLMMFMEVAQNSTRVMAVIAEVMRDRKQLQWGERQIDDAVEKSEQRVRRYMGEDAP